MAQPSDRRLAHGDFCLPVRPLVHRHERVGCRSSSVRTWGAAFQRLWSLLGCYCSTATLVGVEGRWGVRPALAGQLAYGPQILKAV